MYHKKIFIAGVLFWTVIIVVLFWLNLRESFNSIKQTALEVIREDYQKDLLYRRYAANLGGIYVPVSKGTTPNPKLSDSPERVLSTTSRKELTFLNHEDMIKQLNELEIKTLDLKENFTSYELINLQSNADDWEKKAFVSIMKGNKEYFSFDTIAKNEYIRFMGILTQEKNCIKCHASQGEQDGKIRGGISISLPWQPYKQIYEKEMLTGILRFGLTWLIGIIALWFGMYMINLNLKRRFKLEEALKESEERFRLISQSANDAIITIDENDIIIGWNKSAENIFGFTEEEILGKPLLLIQPKKFLELHSAGFKRLKKGGEPHVIGKTVELLGLHKNGLSFPIELSLSEWKTSQGKFFTGIIRDITERKQAEEKLKQSETKYRVLFESSCDALMTLFPPDWKFKSANSATVELFGAKDEQEYTSLGPWNVSPELQPDGQDSSIQAQKMIGMAMEQGSNLFEWTHQKISGETFPATVLLTRIELEGQTGVQATVRDITYQKMAEDEINRKNDELILLNSKKDLFFSIIAHDIKNPLHGLLGLSELMADESSSFSLNEFISISKKLHESASNLYKLIENLLEWGRMQRGMITFSPEFFDLFSIVKTNLDIINERANQKGIAIRNEVRDSLIAYADLNTTNTIIRNLISNAVKFTRKGGNIEIGVIKTSNVLETLDVCIYIKDSGIGMDEETIGNLFKIGEKVKSQGTDGELSTGLGLILCKDFVEMNGGKIWVESEEGKGSTFYFSLPRFEKTSNVFKTLDV
ncbi:MAG: hypothetical protein HW421_1985 [Ignavibacteria bacterium]|nr:hypothetical protein [Ignavibacteria bacterium]